MPFTPEEIKTLIMKAIKKYYNTRDVYETYYTIEKDGIHVGVATADNGNYIIVYFSINGYIRGFLPGTISCCSRSYYVAKGGNFASSAVYIDKNNFEKHIGEAAKLIAELANEALGSTISA